MDEKNYCYQCFNELKASLSGKCPHCGYDASADEEKYPLALPHGSVLNGRYIIGRVLGQGGFGITYIALEWQTGQRLAIKEYFPNTMAVRVGKISVSAYSDQRGESFAYGRDCFLEEAKTLAEFIDNPNVVRIYKCFVENGTAYLAMEYLPGCSLGEYVRTHGGSISWEETKKLILPVMDALGDVHAKGIIHRDVTPDNIFVLESGAVKLLDFGAARYNLGEKSGSLDVILTPGYAAREQYSRRGHQGSYTDIYGLSACCYYAITGQKPPDSIDRLDHDDLIPPGKLGISIPENEEAVLLRGLAVQPADRFQDTASLKQGLLVRRVTGIQLSRNSAKLKPGERCGLKATVTPFDAADKNVIWETSDYAVAGVDRNGYVAARGDGEAVITCMAADGSGVKDTCTVLVGPAKKKKKAKDGASRKRIWLQLAVVIEALVIVVFVRVNGIATERYDQLSEKYDENVDELYEAEKLIEELTAFSDEKEAIAGSVYAIRGERPDTDDEGYTMWKEKYFSALEEYMKVSEYYRQVQEKEITDSWQEIINSVEDGTYRQKYKIGNYKSLDLGDAGTVNMQIAAFDTDVLADGSGMAAITWISKELLKTTHRMNPKDTDAVGGWKKSEMRTYLKDTILPCIPDIVCSHIKTVEKEQWVYDADGESYMQTTQDDIWIPSLDEVFLDGCKYELLFPDDTYRTKCEVDESETIAWWTRSASNEVNFYFIDSDGLSHYFTKSNISDLYGGIALGFCM